MIFLISVLFMLYEGLLDLSPINNTLIDYNT